MSRNTLLVIKSCANTATGMVDGPAERSKTGGVTDLKLPKTFAKGSRADGVLQTEEKANARAQSRAVRCSQESVSSIFPELPKDTRG